MSDGDKPDPPQESLEETMLTRAMNVDAFQQAFDDDGSQTKNGYLFVIGGPLAGQMFKLSRDCSVIGRSIHATIRIDEDGVSRNHAQVFSNEAGELILQDTKSTNGTFVNGGKVSNKVLADGDRIQIGATTLLKFSYQDSDEEAFQQRLYESAIRDGLTGCYNKRYFEGMLQREFSFALRHKKPLSLIIYDLDHFKRVNDSFGHQTGDDVLKDTSAVVTNSIRTEDLLCRYGGEEFTVLLKQTNAGDALVCAERLREDVANHRFMASEQRIPVTVSVGVATLGSERGYATPNDLVRAADNCLYVAKNNGRNRVIADFHSPN